MVRDAGEGKGPPRVIVSLISGGKILRIVSLLRKKFQNLLKNRKVGIKIRNSEDLRSIFLPHFTIG